MKAQESNMTRMFLHRQLAQIAALLLLFAPLNACYYLAINTNVTVFKPASENFPQYQKFCIGSVEGFTFNDAGSASWAELLTDSSKTKFFPAPIYPSSAAVSPARGNAADGTDIKGMIFDLVKDSERYQMVDLPANQSAPKDRAPPPATMCLTGKVKKQFTEIKGAPMAGLPSLVPIPQLNFDLSAEDVYEIELQLIEPISRALIWSRDFSCRQALEASNGNYSATGGAGYFGDLDRTREHTANFLACKQKIARDFAHTIAPHKETYEAHFFLVSDSTHNDQGISNVASKDFFRASQEFSAATKEVEERRAKVVARVWWNLGLALKYAHRFDEARQAFERGLKWAPWWEVGVSTLVWTQVPVEASHFKRELAQLDQFAAEQKLVAQQMLGKNRVEPSTP